MFNSFAFNTLQYNSYVTQTAQIIIPQTDLPRSAIATMLSDTSNITSLNENDLITRLSDITATVILTERNN